MSDQHRNDIDQAKSKLREVEETKEARKDPRAAEAPPLPAAKRPPVESKEDMIKPVTTKPKKKKFGQQLKEAMFSENIGNGSVTNYIFFKVIVPSFKKLVYEGLNTALCMALNMDPKTNRIISIPNTHTANASVYRDRNFVRNDGYSAEARSYGRMAVSDYEWDERTATDIYTQIDDILQVYPDISLMNVYSIMGMPELISKTDRNWGWRSMNGIDMVPVNPEKTIWRVVFPPVVDISR